MSTIPIPFDSIDALIAQQLPGWLTAAQVDHLRALQRAMRRQQANAQQLRELLDAIPALDAYAAPLLVNALTQEGLVDADVRGGQVHIEQEVTLPTAAPNLPPPRYTFTSRQSLLAAALHNYSEEETRTSSLRRAQLLDADGQSLALGFGAFARLCRRLDLGGRYQTVLQTCLRPQDMSARQAIDGLFEESQRSQLEVAVRIAKLKGELDERSYLLMLAVFSPAPIVPPIPGGLTPRQLFLLGKRIHGVVAMEMRLAKDAALESVIVWIPDDPQLPVACYGSWDAVYQALASRLRNASYRTFFSRFISQRDRSAFTDRLANLMRSATAGEPPELDGRNFALHTSLFVHLRTLHIDKQLDDARVLAVPTDDEDKSSRRERLEGYQRAGLDLLNLIGLFVPVLGEVMLTVAAVQLADEVYEGYQDWQLGDRQAALDHLFGVAQSLAVGVVVGKVSEQAFHLTQRVPFVDGLVPLRTDAGRLKLCSDELRAYQVTDRETPLGSPVRYADHWRLRLHEGAYQVLQDPATGNWRIRHPYRADHAPVVEHNGSGGWQHELEQPQYWQGAGHLVRRLGSRLAEVSDAVAQALLEITGFDQAQLRQLHLENAGAPARLLDAVERFELNMHYPALRGEAFEEQMKLRQAMPDAAQGLLIRDFPGLSVRGAREIVEQASGAQVDGMLASSRVPLALAERVRWFLRDSRVDRACAGLYLPQAVNADCERLVLGLIDRLAPWAETLRLELRERAPDGPLLAGRGAAQSVHVRRIIKGRRGYLAMDGGNVGQAAPTDSLLKALLLSMEPRQKVVLGDVQLTELGLRDCLVAHVSSNREQVAELIGMAPIGLGVRPPLRFADGRLGYPLSGRGQGSRQATRRGIQQIYPTLSDDQLNAYLLNVLGRGESLWGHYHELQDQLARLRQALHAWQSEWRNPLDALRRRRVATGLRRCWRRKLVGFDDEYMLTIEGERVGSLPSLPPGVTFSHVRRLVLRDMDLSSLAEDFLPRFDRLIELDLSNNQLTAIPAGIEQLTQLRQLHLSHNQIAMDGQGDRRLGALTRLETLDLSHNPLGRVPALEDNRSLRRLLLRAANLEHLSSSGRELPWRAYIDLRDNRIRQLRGELQYLRQRAQRMSLHDNPLDSLSETLLDQAASVSEPGARGGASARHYAVDTAVRDLWLGDEQGALREQHRALWDRLHQEPGSADLLRFLADFSRLEEFEDYPQGYRRRVWTMLRACEQHEALRLRLFREAGGPRTCEDRLLLIFSQLEISVLAEIAMFAGPVNQVEARLLRLGRSLFRLDEVDRIAALHTLRLREGAEPEVDEIELRLAYRTRLASALDLPAQPEEMYYEDHASITTSDVRRAEAAVMRAETPEALIASLAQRPFWETYMRERHAQRFEALVAPFHERLAQYLDEVESSGERVYMERSNTLMAELATAEHELLLSLTREADERSRT
ncbi:MULTISPECIES: NEL-type E3 ubiquitin ligase domain-containing protein [unclassified Pseudomonas]|uniref:RING-type E3 ubiquitin transferase n=1 Tax=Pseudomonas sp. Hg7Tf TaxID=3236988 RepID=A0AB39I3R1_9PSED|nr:MULTISPECIES: NEL-type E3 ubiquitin ligase domain-containing protein [unclassified Pseudomonas]KJK07175.1 hypothetical protein UB47_13125 [Pseudomonas sp. 5]MDH2557580.1 NEL-type E3 ubiquitin ligase domain-containing protein [Pseudomonas sp. Hg5Tf]QYX47459.1 leucine-rich repeat domain-containing protein [Pseudomonas sp. S11A 273]